MDAGATTTALKADELNSNTLGKLKSHLSHPLLLLCSGIGVIVDSYYFWIEDKHSLQNIIVFTIYLALCAAIPFWPKTICGVTLAWYLISAVSSISEIDAMLVGTWLCLAIAFAFLHISIALCMLCVSVVTLLFITPTNAVIAIVIFQVCASLAGYACKLHISSIEQHRQLELAQNTIHVLTLERMLATRLHDTVTNDLSTIVTVASTRLIDASNESEKRPLEDIIARSQHAFVKAHEIIDILRDENRTDNSEQSLCELKQEITVIFDSEHKRLQDLNLVGTCTIRGYDGPLLVDDAVHAEIEGIVTEAFANLRRHCSPPTDYSIYAEIRRDMFNLVEMNALNMGIQPLQPSGKGLQLHRHTIESFGGKLVALQDQQTWILRVEIPLNHSLFAVDK
jgi:hypothetical protein